MRDDFPNLVKDQLARRVNYLCSNPGCPVATTGPHSESGKSVNKGVAAHITAASPGGKRYDPSLTTQQRRSAENGIWLCQNCAKLIDSDETLYTEELVRAWKLTREAQVRESLQSNCALKPDSSKWQVSLRGSYAGGKCGTFAHIRIFNDSEYPIYLTGWFAIWSDKAMETSIRCVHGELPFRLQPQDAHNFTIDLGRRGFRELKRLGILDGGNRYHDVSAAEIESMTQESERYRKLIEKNSTSTESPENDYRNCEVDIRARIDTSRNGENTLLIEFENKSEIPIKVVGAKIAWEYDPPRERGLGSTSPEVLETGGRVDLDSATNLSYPVSPGSKTIFYLHETMRGVLIQTLMGDVKDEDLYAVVGSNTNIAWKSDEPEIPKIIREYAQFVLDSQ